MAGSDGPGVDEAAAVPAAARVMAAAHAEGAPKERPGTAEDDARELAALEADLGQFFRVGFDRYYWYAWRAHGGDLRADTAGGIREQAMTALGRTPR